MLCTGNDAPDHVIPAPPNRTDEHWCELAEVLLRHLQERMSSDEGAGIVLHMFDVSGVQGDAVDSRNASSCKPDIGTNWQLDMTRPPVCEVKR